MSRRLGWLARQAGMALADLLVAAAVLALFLLLTDRVFLGLYRASRVVQQASELQQNARAAAARLRREVREAWPLAVVCHPDPACASPGTQLAFPSARPSEAASVFCLDVAPEDPARARLESACTTPIPLAGTYAPVAQRFIGYHLSGTDLRRVVQAAPPALPLASSSGQVVAPDVRTFSVTRSGRRIHLRIESFSPPSGGAGGSGPQELRLDDVIQLRNAIPRPVA